MAGLRPDHEEVLVLPWLGPLLQTGFFGHCRNHNSIGKHERNHFCLDCHGSAGALCPEGLGENHKNHLSLQIRKASHRDAVRISDIQKLLDVSGIQAYTINSAKILFLQNRATQPQQQKPQKSSSCSKGGGGVRFNCETCHRSIADQVRFCSINCKRLAVGDSNLVAPVAQDQQQFIDHPSSHHLNLAACSSEDYSLLQFHPGHDKITNVQGSSFESSSSELQHVPNLVTSFRDHARAWHELQAYNSMRTTTTQAENSPLWMQEQSGAASMQKKRKKFCSTPHDHPHQQPQQQLHELGSSNFLLTSSPMSVLALHHHHHHQQQQQPASRSSHENSCKSDLSPRSFFGPSTPPSIEEASSRTHSRKQCHPHRAPLF